MNVAPVASLLTGDTKIYQCHVIHLEKYTMDFYQGVAFTAQI